MKMFFYSFFSWVFLSGIKTFAQKSELSGVIISNTGDTIACTFYKKNWKKQPLEIKTHLNNHDTILSPSDIRGLKISSTKTEYVSKKIRPVLYNELLENAALGKEPYVDSLRYAFLSILYSGALSLYLYIDGLDKKHFFVESEKEIIEIYTHLYMISDSDPHFIVPMTNARTAVLPNKQYINCLKRFMLNCDEVFSIVDETTLNEKSLIKLMNAYSKCLSKKK